VGYIIGLARNARLHAAVEVAEAALADTHKTSGIKERLIGEFSYAAQSWPHERRVITRLEYGEQGTNPRFVVTNLHGEPEALYDELYCQRGEAENRIKECRTRWRRSSGASWRWACARTRSWASTSSATAR
jgi:hypothetical protein